MLQHPNSTASTFWEGYNADGTFNFGGSYMSNSHGWATGVAIALTGRVLGLRSSGDAFVVDPAPGGLAHCRGGLPVAGGRHVSAAWARHGAGGVGGAAADGGGAAADGAAFSVTVDVSRARGMVGTLRLRRDLLLPPAGPSTQQFRTPTN